MEPFTGEVSAEMIHSLGVKYTILGHSERREFFNESNLDLKKKVDLSLSNNLDVIFCCGESLEQRESGIHFDWIKSQIEESLFHLTREEFSKIVINYEPIWGYWYRCYCKSLSSGRSSCFYKICHIK